MLYGSAQSLPSGGVLGDITYALSHFGVPVFFVISGYFFLDKNGEISVRRLWAKVKHIGVLLLGHIVLYAIYEIVSRIIAGQSVNEAITVLKQYFSVKAFIKAAALGTGIMGGGEWFLASLLDAYAILGLIMLNRKLRYALVTYAHVIAVLLFIVHIPVRMYAIKTGIGTLGSFSLSESYAVRNTWLDAIPFLLIGISIRKNYQSIKVNHPITISVFALCIGVGEQFYNAKMIEPYITHDVLYFGIIIAVVMAFILAVNDNGKDSWVARIGCRYSMAIYFFHPLVGWIMKNIYNLKSKTCLDEIIFCSGVIIMSSLTSCIIVESAKRIKHFSKKNK